MFRLCSALRVLTRHPIRLSQPTTSHYTPNDPANLKIRAMCEAKKPVEAAAALSGDVPAPPDVNASLLADGTTVVGTTVAGSGATRKLLRA